MSAEEEVVATALREHRAEIMAYIAEKVGDRLVWIWAADGTEEA